MAYEEKSGYGKRPLWQWIIIYVVIGGLLYGLIYYFVLAKKGGGYGGYGNPSAPSQNMQQNQPNTYSPGTDGKPMQQQNNNY